MRTRGAAIGAVILALAASGCGNGAGSSDARPSNGSAGLASAPISSLREAMPGKNDFPDGWQVQAQSTPPAALPGINGTNTQISSATPGRCLDFAAEFISSPGSSIPGEFVSSVSARIPAPGSGLVTIIAARKTKNWGSPAAIRDSLRDCSDVTVDLSVGGTSNSADFASSPVDTNAIKAEAAGRATVIHAGDEATSFVVVRAQARGVLVVATSHTNPAVGEDQRGLLVKLVGQTVDKLDKL
ncbi:MAG: hypothetical protein ACRC20_12720 [Segniliparus sp.]|uniref:hypothetical protein n=1 Tax=Segniliparus sp. TaxID=2804064 RepID=UPI003F3D2CDC